MNIPFCVCTTYIYMKLHYIFKGIINNHNNNMSESGKRTCSGHSNETTRHPTTILSSSYYIRILCALPT